MLRICKYCGKQYDGDPGSSCCPQCVVEQRKTSVRQRICVECGRSFCGGPAARRCPECRAERIREQNRRYKREGPQRRRGSTDYCVRCGKPYIVESGTQHYCPECAPGAYRELDRAASLRWERENTTPEERKQVRQAASAERICAVCGKAFVPRDASITCSKECSRALAKARNAQFEQEHRAARNAARVENRKRREAAMSPEELEMYRKALNEQARKNYQKRKERKGK